MEGNADKSQKKEAESKSCGCTSGAACDQAGIVHQDGMCIHPDNYSHQMPAEAIAKATAHCGSFDACQKAGHTHKEGMCVHPDGYTHKMPGKAIAKEACGCMGSVIACEKSGHNHKEGMCIHRDGYSHKMPAPGESLKTGSGGHCHKQEGIESAASSAGAQ
eukprot:gb/GEZN01016696.1/.p2 GENE.gb/GEZN01016696.1/~~gb/GEZN01016696.1/.p2  ORF type:complete len:161 (-),score=16.02 gb/GEZN01016696.1/:305-787(-)